MNNAATFYKFKLYKSPTSVQAFKLDQLLTLIRDRPEGRCYVLRNPLRENTQIDNKNHSVAQKIAYSMEH